MAIIWMLVPVLRWSCQTVRLRLAVCLFGASVTVQSVSLHQRHSCMKPTRCWWASTVPFRLSSVRGSGSLKIRWSSLWYLRRVSLGEDIIHTYTEDAVTNAHKHTHTHHARTDARTHTHTRRQEVLGIILKKRSYGKKFRVENRKFFR